MRFQGTLTEWHDDRGWGFISPRGGGPRIFVHVTQFPRDRRRPLVHDVVTYTVGRDGRGRSRAEEVCFVADVERARTVTSTRASIRSSILLLFVPVLLVCAIVGALVQNQGGTDVGRAFDDAALLADDTIAQAYQNQASGVQVTGEGVVDRVLPDDNDGNRHQRFILRLASGQTVLVAHNIDIARRLSSISPGDTVAFCGVFEWNAEGGVIHWTHRDPDGSHTLGWLRHNGMTYQ